METSPKYMVFFYRQPGFDKILPDFIPTMPYFAFFVTFPRRWLATNFTGLNPCHYFLWVYLNDGVFQKKSA
jgi:hypothetical protein